MLSGAAPFYGVYEGADGGYVAVGALEPKFFAALLDGLGLDPAELPGQMDVDAWPELRAQLAAAFATKTVAEWLDVFAGTDACVSAVAELDTELAPLPIVSKL